MKISLLPALDLKACRGRVERLRLQHASGTGCLSPPANLIPFFALLSHWPIGSAPTWLSESTIFISTLILIGPQGILSAPLSSPLFNLARVPASLDFRFRAKDLFRIKMISPRPIYRRLSSPSLFPAIISGSTPTKNP
jgi:hypothetical protein